MLDDFKKHIRLIVISIATYICLLLAIKTDVELDFRWITFSIFTILILTLVFISIKNTFQKKSFKAFFNKKEFLYIGLILITSVLINFFLLKDCPFVSIGDEVRDGGLNAQQIVNGEIKDLFGYGSYESHGKIIPTISSFSYRIFGPSVYSYRVTSAIISCLDILILYLLLRMFVKRKFALLGALTYSVIPYHIFFSRTELVVAFNSFWSSVMLFCLYIFYKKRLFINYVLLGTILGLASQFHGASRITALCILIIVIFTEFFRANTKLRINIVNLLFLIIFYFIGFGPSILYNNAANFSYRNKSVVYDNQIQIYKIKSEINNIEKNYIKSLMVWIYEPTTSRYHNNAPLLTPILSMFFLIGLFSVLFIKNDRFLYTLFFLVFIIPFTNSAITDVINGDHRLYPLIPIGVIFIILGLSWFYLKIKHKLIKTFFTLLFLIYLMILLITFFTTYSANNNYELKDYLSMHVVYFLKSNDKNYLENKNIYLFVSPANYENLRFLHYQEQYKYFFPSNTIIPVSKSDINDNEIYISIDKYPGNYKDKKNKKVIICSENGSLYCPKNYQGEIILHY